MKVFWSWQSDHEGRISRHFVREALSLAIKAINESDEISEADRDDLTLDHDRKGVPGSPDLANVILEKIKASDVFVADVTPVGKTKGDPPKPLINSNVAIELGYAFHVLTDRKLIMIMNSHFGSHNDLPFDLRHKAGPIFYQLAPDGDKDTIKTGQKRLVTELTAALREIHSKRTRKEGTPYRPWPSIEGDPSRYRKVDEPLFTKKLSMLDKTSTPFFVPNVPLLYLRIMPSAPVVPLTRPEADKIVRETHSALLLQFRGDAPRIE